jgi:hypothetical protein
MTSSRRNTGHPKGAWERTVQERLVCMRSGGYLRWLDLHQCYRITRISSHPHSPSVELPIGGLLFHRHRLHQTLAAYHHRTCRKNARLVGIMTIKQRPPLASLRGNQKTCSTPYKQLFLAYYWHMRTAKVCCLAATIYILAGKLYGQGQ